MSLKSLPPKLDTSLTRSSSNSSITEPDSASKTFTRALVNTIDDETMSKILQEQRETTEILQSTNKSLESFNDFSAAKYTQNLKNLENYTKMLREMKGDLDVVFKRIRAIRAKVATRYPEQYAEVARQREEEERQLDDE